MIKIVCKARENGNLCGKVLHTRKLKHDEPGFCRKHFKEFTGYGREITGRVRKHKTVKKIKPIEMKGKNK